MQTPQRETTDSWPLGKLIKYTLLPRPKTAPPAGRKEYWVRGITSLFFLAVAVAAYFAYI